MTFSAKPCTLARRKQHRNTNKTEQCFNGNDQLFFMIKNSDIPTMPIAKTKTLNGTPPINNNGIKTAKATTAVMTRVLIIFVLLVQTAETTISLLKFADIFRQISRRIIRPKVSVKTISL